MNVLHVLFSELGDKCATPVCKSCTSNVLQGRAGQGRDWAWSPRSTGEAQCSSSTPRAQHKHGNHGHLVQATCHHHQVPDAGAMQHPSPGHWASKTEPLRVHEERSQVVSSLQSSVNVSIYSSFPWWWGVSLGVSMILRSLC